MSAIHSKVVVDHEGDQFHPKETVLFLGVLFFQTAAASWHMEHIGITRKRFRSLSFYVWCKQRSILKAFNLTTCKASVFQSMKPEGRRLFTQEKTRMSTTATNKAIHYDFYNIVGQRDGSPKHAGHRRLEPATVPNLRVCKHFWHVGGTRKGEDRINVLPWYRLVSMAQKLHSIAKEEEPGCPQG